MPTSAIQGFNAPATAGRKNDQLGQEEFLKLMITQFQNQDPFKPMESGEFLGQIAQFGTVSGIQEMQTSFANLSNSLLSHQSLQGASLIGHDVLVDSDQVNFTGTSVRGAADAPVAGKVAIAIYDEAGTLVRRMDLGEVQGGLVEYEWDGFNNAGARVPAGRYFVEAEFSTGGQNYVLQTLVFGRVNSVTMARDGSGLKLEVSNVGEAALNRVRRII